MKRETRSKEYQRRARLAGFLAALVAISAGCGGRREQFIAGRALDQCNQSWPVCDTIAGCLIGEESYLAGRLPGDRKLVVRLAEESTVRVHVFVENTGAAGEETSVTWFEDRCRARLRTAVSGRAFVGEAEQLGEFVRDADLTAVGDHLIELQSDAQAEYTVKLEILPKRLQD